jgi:UDP-N-acetylglucosamine--N-acetylmuramyl-(pentapeptide) pyrophosphoryl-undecaprenol N-acetylglucosamine transferase
MFACGGTGGHIYPALAVADELKRLDADTDIMFIAGSKGMERSIIERAGYTMETLPVIGLPRTASLRLIPFVWLLGISVVKARSGIVRFKPSVVMATGGYVSAPPVIAAHILGVPVVMQEQNSYPGIVTRRFAKFADTVFLGFDEAKGYINGKAEMLTTGNPVRNVIGDVDRSSAAKSFSLDPSLRTILVFGGSQGARAINKVVADTLISFKVNGIQVIWQTGKLDYEKYSRLDCKQVRVLAYIDNMSQAYGASDLAITRAGAMTIAELSACGLPAVFIPLPTAAANHQEHNARSLVSRGAASMIIQKELTAGRLWENVAGILNNTETLGNMCKTMKTVSRTNAAEVIARRLIDRFGHN